jgi:hypothetical protein
MITLDFKPNIENIRKELPPYTRKDNEGIDIAYFLMPVKFFINGVNMFRTDDDWQEVPLLGFIHFLRDLVGRYRKSRELGIELQKLRYVYQDFVWRKTAATLFFNLVESASANLFKSELPRPTPESYDPSSLTDIVVAAEFNEFEAAVLNLAARARDCITEHLPVFKTNPDWKCWFGRIKKVSGPNFLFPCLY